MGLKDGFAHVKKIKDSLPVDDVKKFFRLNEAKINRVIKFSTAVVNDANTLLNGATKPGLLSYASLVSKVKSHYDSQFHENAWGRFAHKWEGLNSNIHQVIGEVMTGQFSHRIVGFKQDNNDYRFLIMDTFTMGWVVNHQGHAQEMNIEAKKMPEFKKIFAEAFWNHFGDYAILSAGTHSQVLFETDPQIEVIYSERAIRLSQYFEKFMAKKISRSILFYGPPGTGKSNIVRAIAHGMKMKALKFNIVDFKKLNAALVHNMISMVCPDVIIIEDIDHAPLNNDCQILAIMEMLNKTGKLTLATTNEVSTINHAVIRPGRFDELIEIDKFDDEVLMKIVDQDKEIFDIVKNFPIASTMELMTRIKVLGRAEALNSIGDIQKRFENMKKSYNCAL